jgi:hypothetical protein
VVLIAAAGKFCDCSGGWGPTASAGWHPGSLVEGSLHVSGLGYGCVFLHL